MRRQQHRLVRLAIMAIAVGGLLAVMAAVRPEDLVQSVSGWLDRRRLDLPPPGAPVAFTRTHLDVRGLQGMLRERRFGALSNSIARVLADAGPGQPGEITLDVVWSAFAPTDPQTQDLLDEWVRTQPQDRVALLARAWHATHGARVHRSTGTIDKTTPPRLAAMRAAVTAALTDVDTLTARDPHAIEPHVIAATIAGLLGDATRCRRAAEAALTLAPESFRVRVPLVRCLDPIAAARVAREAQGFAGANPHLAILPGLVLSAVARTYAERGSVASAFSILDEALAYGRHPAILRLRGELHYGRRAWTAAITDADEITSLFPDDVDALVLRALALMRLDQRAEALTAADVVRELDPTRTDTAWVYRHESRHLVRQARGLAKAGATTEALTALGRAHLLAPTDADPLLERGRTHVVRQSWEAARRDFEAAATADPTSFDAYRELDRLAAREQRWDQVIALWDRFLAVTPKHPRALVARAAARLAAGDRDGAQADATIACEMRDAEACHALGRPVAY